jgi:hypothetical protein
VFLFCHQLPSMHCPWPVDWNNDDHWSLQDCSKQDWKTCTLCSVWHSRAFLTPHHRGHCGTVTDSHWCPLYHSCTNVSRYLLHKNVFKNDVSSCCCATTNPQGMQEGKTWHIEMDRITKCSLLTLQPEEYLIIWDKDLHLEITSLCPYCMWYVKKESAGFYQKQPKYLFPSSSGAHEFGQVYNIMHTSLTWTNQVRSYWSKTCSPARIPTGSCCVDSVWLILLCNVS